MTATPRPIQWKIIWLVAIVLILGWPADQGKSLATKAVNWLVDPGDLLPAPPKPLPMGLDDDGDVVAAHDMQEAEYNRLYVKHDRKSRGPRFVLVLFCRHLPSSAILRILPSIARITAAARSEQ